MKGYFIVLEGMDGSGTTTQTQALVNFLRSMGRKAIGTAEPSSGPIGQLLRKCLEKKERHAYSVSPEVMALLFAADRLDHYDHEIGPLLNKGIDVVCDRYLLSSVVYQGMKLDVEHIKMLNAQAPEPDFSVLLDLNEETAAQRRKRRGLRKEVFDDAETQALVRKRYLEFAPSFNTQVLSGNEDRETVSRALFDAVQKHFSLKRVRE